MASAPKANKSYMAVIVGVAMVIIGGIARCSSFLLIDSCGVCVDKNCPACINEYAAAKNLLVAGGTLLGFIGAVTLIVGIVKWRKVKRSGSTKTQAK